MMAGIDMIHVPYRGTGPAITDLLGGQVQVMFGSAPSSVQYIRNGQLRALAVTSAKRLEALPDIPTVGETMPGYEASQWYGIGVPKGTPAPIVDLLNTRDQRRARRPEDEGEAQSTSAAPSCRARPPTSHG